MTNLRVPPHSIEAERAVLGAILFSPDKIYSIHLNPEEFFDRRHQVLYEHMKEMSVSNMPMDAITIFEYLKDKNVLDKVGGPEYLVQIQDSGISVHHSQQYADTVHEKAALRNEIDVYCEAIDEAFKGDSQGTEVISKLSSHLIDDTDLSMHQHAEKFIDDCINEEVGNFRWWCDEWDHKFGKLKAPLMILHAQRSTGKTALMLQWIRRAHEGGQRTPVASIEMLKEELSPRFVSSIGGVNTFLMATRRPTADEVGKARIGAEGIKRLDLCIKDKGMSIDDIMSWAISESRKGCDAVFIDNLLSINDGGKQFQSKTIMYDYFIRKLRDLRDILKVPIVLLAHPNADGAIAWSKDVENFADIILYLHEVPEEGLHAKGGREIPKKETEGKHIVGKFQKWRQGVQCMVHLDFIGEIQTFRHIGFEY